MDITLFLQKWSDAAYTSTGFFWKALWAFVLGYLISSFIQVFVTENRMKKVMGKEDSKSIFLGTFFGFISSSCSFSALATTKSLFQKGASFPAAIAFLLASTNLVIELGIIIAVFLSWQFVVGEYLGGLLLILISWGLIRVIRPDNLVEQAQKKMGEAKGHQHSQKESFSEKIKHAESWAMVGKKYKMEWGMVWKDVTIGFTVAGLISAFVPETFFQSLFLHTGEPGNFDFLTLLEHVLVGPFAAFLTFIGSMGNIPLAALLYGKGVSFAGVMAFIFSDLVVLPVLRINAKYYGWKMSFFILFLLFTSLIVTSISLHYGFYLLDLLPEVSGSSIENAAFFKVDYTLALNLLFLAITCVLIYFGFSDKSEKSHHHHEMAPKNPAFEMVLKILSFGCYLWLASGLMLRFFYF